MPAPVPPALAAVLIVLAIGLLVYAAKLFAPSKKPDDKPDDKPVSETRTASIPESNNRIPIGCTEPGAVIRIVKATVTAADDPTCQVDVTAKAQQDLARQVQASGNPARYELPGSFTSDLNLVPDPCPGHVKTYTVTYTCSKA